MAQQLSVQTRTFIWAVIVSGIGAGLWLATRASVSPGDWPPILLFGGMAALATAASISYRGSQPSSVTYQIMTAFAYAAFLLVDPAAVCAVLWLSILADKFLNSRRWLKTAFNIGQMSLAVTLAHLVQGWVQPDFDMVWLDAPTVMTATVSILAFALVNHGLIQIVISLADQRRLLRWSFALRTGLLLEFLCVLSGVGMALLWSITPWLALYGAIPTWTMFFLVQMLSRRENDLQAREVELHSLQDLGLELGAELDVSRLRASVLRIACDALKADCALLVACGPQDPGSRPSQDPSAPSQPPPAPRGPWRVVAQRNYGELPERLALADLDEWILEPLRVRHVESPDGPGWSALPSCDGALLAPIEVRGHCTGALILTHGSRRRAFTQDDVRRLESLMRFVNVALSNAEMVAELGEINEQLAHSEKMSALGMLVSGVAHELNNPLTSVLGYAELLRAGEASPRRGKMLDTISREAKRAGKIVNNLLMFSRKRKPSKRLVEVNRIVGDVLDFRAYEQSVRNVLIFKDLTDGLPAILADPHQLHQVLLNLVTNAEQAIGDSGKPGRITVRTEHHGDRVRVTVADDGPGIPAKHLKQVFVPFFTTKEVGRGTGLGLSICYGIVHEHGGKIEAHSVPGRGSTIVIDLPAADVQAGSTTAAPVVAAPEVRHVGRLLVVDDEHDITDLLTIHFEGRGWTVRSASDGREALELIGAETFDAVIVDLRMPGMDGTEFYGALTESHPRLAERVVFATGDAGDAASARFLDQIQAQLVPKPFDLETLERAVVRCLRTAEDAAIG